MSDTPQKRPWFQYHLSTAIILMFVAAGMLWVNFTIRGTFLGGSDMVRPMGPTYQFAVEYELGWPNSLLAKRKEAYWTWTEGRYMAEILDPNDTAGTERLLEAQDRAREDLRRILLTHRLDDAYWQQRFPRQLAITPTEMLDGKLNLLNLFLDALIAVAIIFAVGVILEWRIRRSDARRARAVECGLKGRDMSAQGKRR